MKTIGEEKCVKKISSVVVSLIKDGLSHYAIIL
jgi:hypothetical protein